MIKCANTCKPNSMAYDKRCCYPSLENTTGLFHLTILGRDSRCISFDIQSRKIPPPNDYRSTKHPVVLPGLPSPQVSVTLQTPFTGSASPLSVQSFLLSPAIPAPVLVQKAAWFALSVGPILTLPPPNISALHGVWEPFLRARGIRKNKTKNGLRCFQRCSRA